MGGRHGYGTTFSKLQNGLAIDLSRLNGVTIDRQNETIQIEGGAKIRDVINSVAAAGFQIGK
jgi:FAD/FMN-containing dehydrogenase